MLSCGLGNECYRAGWETRMQFDQSLRLSVVGDTSHVSKSRCQSSGGTSPGLRHHSRIRAGRGTSLSGYKVHVLVQNAGRVFYETGPEDGGEDSDKQVYEISADQRSSSAVG